MTDGAAAVILTDVTTALGLLTISLAAREHLRAYGALSCRIEAWLTAREPTRAGALMAGLR